MLYMLLWTLWSSRQEPFRLEYPVGCVPLRLGYLVVGIPTNTWCEATLYSLGAAGTRLSLGVPIGHLLLCLARHA